MDPIRQKIEQLEKRVFLDASGSLAVGIDELGTIPWNNTAPFVETAPELIGEDFDGDGIADLLVANELELQFFLNRGQDSIVAPDLTLLQSAAVKELAAADFNGDGLTDVFTHDQSSMQIWLNESTSGELSFSDPIVSAGFLDGKFVLEDLNSDSKADIVHAAEGGILVQLGNGDGGFAEAIRFSEATDFAVTNLNHDEFPDLLVPYSGSVVGGEVVMTEHMFYNNGEGFFEFAGELVRNGPGSYFRSMLPSIDLNHDGIGDRMGFPPFAQSDLPFFISLSKNGTLEWQDEGTYFNDDLIGGGGYAVPEFSDVNQDGQLDLVLSTSPVSHSRSVDGRSGGTTVMLGQAGGQFAKPIRVSNRIGRIAVGDQLLAISSEGQIQFVRFAGSEFQQGEVLESLGMNLVLVDPEAWRFEVILRATELIDANNDGRLDVIRDRETAWINTGQQSFDEDKEILIGDEGGLITERLDNNRAVEISEDEMPAPLFDAWRSYEASDFNGDGHMDVVVIDSSKRISELRFDGTANDWEAILTVWMSDGANEFNVGQQLGRVGYAFDVSDTNQDGISDLVALTHQTESSPPELVLFEGTSSGLVEQRRLPAPAEVNFVRAADLNGDGAVDYIMSSLDQRLTLLLSDAEDFERREYDIEQQVDEVVVADLDLDGKLDLLVAEFGTEFRPVGFNGDFGVEAFASPNVKLRTLSAVGNNAFALSSTTSVRAFTINTMAVEDFDNDGDADILLGGDDLVIIWNSAAAEVSGLTLEDIHTQCEATRTGDLTADRNADNLVDGADLELLMNGASTPIGDTNLDGVVDFTDFLELSVNYGSTDAVWEQGDFDCDGKVTFADFLILSANFGVE